MTTLVTGATGFLGRHLVPLLAERGDRIRALVRDGTDVSELDAVGAEVVRGDIGDEAALRRAAPGCGLVFHLAGVVSHQRSDEALLARVNVEGVRNLLAATEPEARVVHVSSVSTLGPSASRDRRVSEDDPFPPEAERLVYVRTKRAGERLALEAAEAGRDVVVANPGFLIGPGDVHRVSTWMVQRYLQGALRLVIDGGLSFTDSRDVARGLVLLAEKGTPGERTILTSRAGNLTLEAFFRRVGEVTGKSRRMLKVPKALAVAGAKLVPWPVKSDEIDAVGHWWFFDPSKAERELGFTTRPVDETIEATAAQYL